MTHSRIEENRDLYDFELSAEDMETLHTGKYEPCAWGESVHLYSRSFDCLEISGAAPGIRGRRGYCPSWQYCFAFLS